MKYFEFKNDELFVEDLSVDEIAKEVGTPFYCYSKKNIIENYQTFYNAFKDIDHKICYAIKANPNVNLVKIFAKMGAGIDVVSKGEIFRSIKAGIDPKNIVFAGVGKTADEMRYALERGVEEFSVESESELDLLSDVASTIGKIAKFSLRVNPNVDANTHDKISTGRKGDKFGVDIHQAVEIYEKAKTLPGIEIFGISTHIGSQITSLVPFKESFIKIRELCINLTQQGFAIKNLDFGGGIGIIYNEENAILIEEYASIIKDAIKDLNTSVTIAPGRALIGNSSIMVTKVIHVKKTSHKNFLIVDSAMNDLMRPGLYDSYHKLVQVKKKHANSGTKYEIAGPICETTDILAKNRFLSDPRASDLLAFYSCGAYGASMSNEYNSRPLIPEVLIDGDKFEIIRRRPSYAEMIRLEVN
jgi:diaminopimelate decarboxylase